MPSETVQRLRQQLREKFPAAHRGGSAGILPAAFGLPPDATPPPRGGVTHSRSAGYETGTPIPPSRSDASPFELGTSNFPQGAITEISPAHPACGLTLLLAALLSETPKSGNGATPALVLIDARDRFDPASFTPEECRRLLWLRCRETRQALQSTDLLLRDGNLPFVLLDLSALPARELRRIPTASWHRLRQLAETSACTLLVLTPTPLIPRAVLRLRLTRELTLQDLDLTQAELLPHLHAETTHRHARTA